MLLSNVLFKRPRPHSLRQRRSRPCVRQPFGGEQRRVGHSVKQTHRFPPRRSPAPPPLPPPARPASYSSTLVATAAFRLSTGPGQGIVTAPSAFTARSGGTP